MTQGMSIGQFLGHSNRGGRKAYLKNWRDKPPHAVTVWLSCNSPIVALWRHGWQKVEVRKDRETQATTREVWSSPLVCYEEEQVLQNMYWRSKDTGLRDYPPVVCPHCLMIEDVYQRISAGWVTRAELVAKNPKIGHAQIAAELLGRGQLDWCEPLFRFEGSDPSKTLVVHAAGLFNGFGAKGVTAEQKVEMAAVPRERGGPIYQKNAWRETQTAKLTYAFAIVNHDDANAGVQIAVEANLLGDKVKGAIARRMKDLGEQEGNPLLYPVAFRWEYDPTDGVEFGKKYDAIPMTKITLTPAVDKLIRDEEVPDMGPLTEKFNLRAHRANLEKHAIVQLPWDDYFKAAFRAEEARGGQAVQAAERTSPEVGRSLPAPTPSRAAYVPPPVEDELFGCDAKLSDGTECGAPMKGSDATCGKCGAKYNVVGEPSPPPPPPLPKRSEARAARAAVAQTPAPAQRSVMSEGRGSLGALTPAPEDIGNSSGGYPGDPDDGIPF